MLKLSHVTNLDARGTTREIVRSSLATRIVSIVAIPVAFQILLLAAIALQQRVQAADREAQLRHTELHATADCALGLVLGMESAVRGYALANDAVFAEPFKSARKRDEVIARIASAKGKQVVRFRGAMRRFLLEEESHDAERRDAALRSENAGYAIIWCGFVLNVFVAVAACMVLTRSIVNRLEVGNDEIALLRFHEMADNLNRTRRHLEESNRDLESFSYSVSHDLRAPLRAIDGYAQMIQEDYGAAFDANGRRFIATLRSEAARLGKCIDDLLTFSWLGRKPVMCMPFEMKGVAREDFAEVTASANGSKPQLFIEPLPCAVGDRSLIRQVLMNLISNAVKFSEKREQPRISVGGSPNGVENTYWVCDNGVGFDSRYAEKLFNMFQRLHHDDDFPGTGVGLAIVRRVVQRHGGRVWAESENGRGACFYFTLLAANREARVA